MTILISSLRRGDLVLDEDSYKPYYLVEDLVDLNNNNCVTLHVIWMIDGKFEKGSAQHFGNSKLYYAVVLRGDQIIR